MADYLLRRSSIISAKHNFIKNIVALMAYKKYNETMGQGSFGSAAHSLHGEEPEEAYDI